MYKIITKKELAPNIYLIEIEATDVAKKSNPGQFVILRLNEKGERIPLTIAGVDLLKGTVATAFHAVGRTTKKLAKMNAGDSITDLSGPLGNPAEVDKFGRVLLVGGGVWCAPLYYIAQALRKNGTHLLLLRLVEQRMTWFARRNWEQSQMTFMLLLTMAPRDMRV